MAAPTPWKCSQGASALPRGFAEVGAASPSFVSQQNESLLVLQFAAQPMDLAKPNDPADLAFGELK